MSKRSQIKVCILTSVHPSFDGRIFHKEAKTLAKAGYNVVLITQHSKEETMDGIRIISLPKPKNRFGRMTKVVWKLFRLALKEKADVYHFHDPELISIGLILKSKGKRVIYDVHEDTLKQILNKEWVGNIFIRRIVAFITYIVEQAGAFLFDGIVATTPEIAKRFNPSKTILVRNFPILKLIDEVEPTKTEKSKPIIIYAGLLTRIRGIKEIIQAMEFIGGKAELWLLGEWESEEFQKECADLSAWRYTKYMGFKSLEEVYSYLKIANVGLHCVHRIERYMRGLPTKVFEYAASQLPIVISDSDYWRDKFGEFALFVDPKKPEDIADKILKLLEDERLSSRLGKKGREFVKKDHNWECESNKLLKVYKNVINGGREQ